MDLSVGESDTVLDCDGGFEVTLTFKNNARSGDRISLRIMHNQPPPPPPPDPPVQFDRNVQDVRLDHPQVSLKPGATHQVVVTGRLQDRCSAGQLSVVWFQTIGGAEVPRTREDVLLMIPPAPFIADASADPVVADPAGVFRYRVTLKCCQNGGPAQKRNVDYGLGTVDVRYARATSDGTPIELDCPNEVDWIDVAGVLEDPRKGGQVTVTISGGGRCRVVTRIDPNPSPDRAAHRLAVQEWED